MAVEVVQQQIEKFLSSETPEVMSIKGDWGVGKTYAWNKYLKFAKNKNKIALGKYSYVSLFGVNSLGTLNSPFLNILLKINLLVVSRPWKASGATRRSSLVSSVKNLFPLRRGTAPLSHTMVFSILFCSCRWKKP